MVAATTLTTTSSPLTIWSTSAPRSVPPENQAPLSLRAKTNLITPSVSVITRLRGRWTAEQKAAGEGSGAWQPTPASGGFATGGGATATSGGATSSTGGYTATTGGTTGTTTGGTTGTTTGGTTGTTTGGTTGTTTGGMTTITSPTGRSVTYIGTDKNNLNLRNLKAKEQTDLLSK